MEAVCLLFRISSDLYAIRVVTLELLLAAGDVANGLVAAVDTVRVSVAGPVLWDAVPLVPALELSRGAPCCVAQLVPFVKTVHLCQGLIEKYENSSPPCRLRPGSRPLRHTARRGGCTGRCCTGTPPSGTLRSRLRRGVFF